MKVKKNAIQIFKTFISIVRKTFHLYRFYIFKLFVINMTAAFYKLYNVVLSLYIKHVVRMLFTFLREDISENTIPRYRLLKIRVHLVRFAKIDI